MKPLLITLLLVLAAQAADTISASDPRIQVIGRVDRSDPARIRMQYPGITLRFRFTGEIVVADIDSDQDEAYVTVVVEGGKPEIRRLAKGANEVAITAQGFGPHTVEVVKRNGSWQGITTFEGIRLGSGATLVEPPPLPTRKLLFLGDSVTCGEGIDNYPVCPGNPPRSANAYDSYGMLLGRRLDAQSELVCFGGRGVIRDWQGKRDVLNAPQFIDYSIPAEDPAQRAKWSDDGWKPDAIIVSLGTNDWNLQKSQPISQSEFVTSYAGFVQKVRQYYPNAWIVLTQGSIVSDPLLSEYVQATVKQVNDPHVVWFASRHFPGSTCDGHPDKPQQQQMADDFEAELRKLLGW